MKSKLNKNLTNINKFFKLIRTEFPTREEIYNFLLECKSFIFSEYGLNENDYDIKIHFINPKELDFDEAEMCADANDIYKFEIKLNSHKLSNKYSLLNKENVTLSKKELLEQRQAAILTLTISYFHELGHIFQYIRSPKMMEREDEMKQAITDAFEQVCLMMPNNRETRLILKTLGKHINALAYMSTPEKDADKKAHIYFSSILYKLIRYAEQENDEEMIDFLSSIFAYINKAKKHNHKIYRQYTKENNEAIEKLHELDFENKLQELTSSFEN